MLLGGNKREMKNHTSYKVLLISIILDFIYNKAMIDKPIFR